MLDPAPIPPLAAPAEDAPSLTWVFKVGISGGADAGRAGARGAGLRFANEDSAELRSPGESAVLELCGWSASFAPVPWPVMSDAVAGFFTAGAAVVGGVR